MNRCLNLIAPLKGTVLEALPGTTRGMRTGRATPAVDAGTGRVDFKLGQTYSPWMFNQASTDNVRNRRLPQPPKRADVFKLLKVNPMDMWKDVTFLSQFVTEMGFMKRREETGLTHKNQALVGRAIRRARCAGLMG